MRALNKSGTAPAGRGFRRWWSPTLVPEWSLDAPRRVQSVSEMPASFRRSKTCLIQRPPRGCEGRDRPRPVQVGDGDANVPRRCVVQFVGQLQDEDQNLEN